MTLLTIISPLVFSVSVYASTCPIQVEIPYYESIFQLEEAIKCKQEIWSENSKEQTIMEEAINKSDIKVVQLLAKTGGVEVLYSTSMSPVATAISLGEWEILEILVNIRGYDVNSVTSKVVGNNLRNIVYAANLNEVEALKIMLTKANRDKFDKRESILEAYIKGGDEARRYIKSIFPEIR